MQGLRANWLTFAKTATWMLALLSTFLITPPLIRLADESTIKPVVRFIIAALVALMFIPSQRYSSKTSYGAWLRLSVASFALAAITTVGYFLCVDNWCVDFYGKTLVVGSHMTREASERKKELAGKLRKPFIDDETFIKSREGETQYIWPISEIRHHFYILVILYLCSALLLSFFIMSVSQAIHCYQSHG